MLIDNNGTDFWWQLPLEKLFPEDLRGGLPIDQIEKGQVNNRFSIESFFLISSIRTF